MGSTAAIVAAALLVVLIGFQIGLALGAPWGKLAWGGRHRILPAPLRMGSGLSIVIYALIALILLSRADVVQVFGATAATVLTWIVTGVSAAEYTVTAADCNQPVPSGGSCQLHIVFAPTGIGVRTASLIVSETECPRTTGVVPLTGIGTTP